MVEKISKISSTVPSNATRIDQSVSVAEPDIAWVANRQTVIDTALSGDMAGRPHIGQHVQACDDGQKEGGGVKHQGQPESDAEQDVELLSGESKRIGTGNLDDETVTFGAHVGFL
jgi:hypothetical protein